MRYLRGIITWIDSLESGRQFRSWAAILVKILGVIASVGISVWGIVICVNTIGASKDLVMLPFGTRHRHHPCDSPRHAVLEQIE